MGRWHTCFVSIMLFVFCISPVAMAQAGLDEKPSQEITAVDTTKTTAEGTTEKKVRPPVVDEIALKQKEMLDTTVLIQTWRGSGSGTIIDCTETEIEGVFEYCVLTNTHVTQTRFVTIIQGVDALTGKVTRVTTDHGCGVTIFDHEDKKMELYHAKVVAEDIKYDLALLSFQTKQKLAVAILADRDMLERVRIFDEIFAIGCQLGRAPSPTTGIISQIITGNNGEKEWVIYGNTAQITPGSSGGGLFKKYDGHYHLIGIPFRVAVAGNGQIVPHLAHAISIEVARDFIDQNMVSHP